MYRYDPFWLISSLNATLPWVKNLKFLDCLFLVKKKTLEEMFWNILDEKEFLDKSHHIGLDFPQALPRHTFSQKSLFWAKTA